MSKASLPGHVGLQTPQRVEMQLAVKRQSPAPKTQLVSCKWARFGRHFPGMEHVVQNASRTVGGRVLHDTFGCHKMGCKDGPPGTARYDARNVIASSQRSMQNPTLNTCINVWKPTAKTLTQATAPSQNPLSRCTRVPTEHREDTTAMPGTRCPCGGRGLPQNTAQHERSFTSTHLQLLPRRLRAGATLIEASATMVRLLGGNWGECHGKCQRWLCGTTFYACTKNGRLKCTKPTRKASTKKPARQPLGAPGNLMGMVTGHRRKALRQ